MSQAPIELVLSRVERPKKVGSRWTAHCPAHEDGDPSLSIAEADDGRVLLHCHAGCAPTAVIAAMGLSMKDLFVDGTKPIAEPQQSPETLMEERALSMLLHSVHRAEHDAFALVGQYDYDLMGGGRLRVLRYEDGHGSKTIRQMVEVPGAGWVLRRGDAPALPYKHEQFERDEILCVVEGEKCADALHGIGIPATTSAGGAKAASRTCWDGLCGMRLALLPDNDEAGQDYVRDVLKFSNPTSARVVELPDLGPGEDVADFIAQAEMSGHNRASIKDLVLSLVAETEPDKCPVPRRAPFPIDVLPPEVVSFVRAVANSRFVDVSVAGAFAMAAISSAVGLSRIAWDDYADWEEIPVIWMALVARSGTRKTVIIRDFFGIHMDRQWGLHQEFQRQQSEYQHELDKWKQKQKSNKSLEIEPRPEQPILQHVYSSDTTPEGLVKILEHSPRGIVVLTDELTSFFGGLGKYSGMKDAERAFFLSLFSGMQFKKDRVGSEPILIEKASASIVGGVQPGILRKCFDADAFASGLASRFLLLNPPPQVKKYGRGPSAKEKTAYADFIHSLFELGMEPYSSSNGEVETRPLRVPIDEGARDLLREFVPDWSAESLSSTANVEAAMSKLEGYSIRFALLLRVCREVGGGAQPHDPITRDDLENGILMARWFRDEALAVYDELGRDDGTEAQDVLLARVAVIRERHDGAVTVREWRKSNNRKTRDTARKELDEIVHAGLAQWRARPTGPAGGRPTEECALLNHGPVEGAGEVTGFGLRGAQGKQEGADSPQNHPEGPKKEGGDHTVVEGCTPKPPRGSLASGGSGAEPGGDHPDEATPAEPNQSGPAPRNPKPETPSGDVVGGNSVDGAEHVHPETPDAFVQLLIETFDGVEVPPLEPDGEFVDLVEITGEVVR